MKKVVLVVIFIQSFVAKAQIVSFLKSAVPIGAQAVRSAKKERRSKVENLNYTIDTIRFREEVVPIQRYSPNDLHGALGNNSAQNNVLLSLISLQSELDQMNTMLFSGLAINGASSKEPYFITKIKAANTGFDLSNYEREYALYHRFRAVQSEEEIESARQQRLEKIAQDRKENDERERELARKQTLIEEERRIATIERERVVDSITEVNAKREAKLEAARQKKARIAAQEKKEKRKADLISKYGYENGSIIASGKVKIGMTMEMCIAAWGKPYDINRTTNRHGVSEQWVYNMKSFLYFDEGILTSISN